ncbi:TRAP transporter small permease [Vannielia litorea]|uniref:TRAP transporter small permease n=1 Tax=Vannielia litorea TaxID=1217970 RepID=UPI001C96C24D|nr:TRAP transporter small permease subunit [Vannielia litorea]MBY6049043.1 TRAP transporter small permease [Vannielia litorea]MBY6076457.1 TRAP transporter small permease [Vannielia litorea]
MPPALSRLAPHARAAAEAVPAVLLVAMFLCFIFQVFMRYVMDSPVGWTVEVCVISWVWILLWGQSVSVSEEDEIRFDILYVSVSARTRRIFRALFSIFLVAVYAVSLPALWDYVTFMKIQKTSYLDLRFNWVYSIALVFSVVTILRYLLILIDALRGGAREVSRVDMGQ